MYAAGKPAAPLVHIADIKAWQGPASDICRS